MKPVFLGLDDVIEIHSNQIARYGGNTGIRHIGLLQSAIAIPAAGCDGDYLHAHICEKAADYLSHIVV